MLSKYIENFESSTDDADICEKVVGGKGNLAILAQIFDNHNDLFNLIELHCLLVWTKKADYNTGEAKAFRAGLSSVKKFLDKCSKELQTIQNKK